MKITEDPQFRADLIKQIQEREFSERTGIHCSDLIYCLNKQALRRIKPMEDTETETLLFSLGWATQRWLTGKDEDEEPREIDGIIVTCDALVRTDSVNVIPTLEVYKEAPWELKATYQSSNRPIEENLAWIRQIMAQCYVTGSITAFLSRFELLGDWGSVYPRGKSKEEKAINRKASQRPTLHAYRLEFTKEEVDRNWEWLKGRRDTFAKILETEVLLPKPLALASGQTFECDYCKYKEECETSHNNPNSHGGSVDGKLPNEVEE